ncbi:sugar transferase [uncultured Nonlabens sp.]|jgi:lipopolysaccharide/colanic/teichoic acid biosynthesis glycosyltransferase|uniref:sugar transferase n=1 Tax=uncultured Nonlabens sp. TaxID=859306 RepID=UPI0030DB4B96|tara:strand:- start:4370 stop:4981 length:612 start_codon:yes stop_codon:yes gene_type:complete
MYRYFLKPLLDSCIALVAFIFLLPVFMVVFVFLLITNSGSSFFYQLRPGKHGTIFKIIKFKTMNDKKDIHGNLLSDDQRLTKIGQIIRKTSLDEIPQLLNVIKGDMSIVGPRPLLPQYLKLYSKQQARRHEVKPGITGWAQVNGRNAISWEEKFQLDVWYVEHQSFLLDLKIIFKTFKKVFVSEGISQEGQATTTFFKGSSNE